MLYAVCDSFLDACIVNRLVCFEPPERVDSLSLVTDSKECCTEHPLGMSHRPPLHPAKPPLTTEHAGPGSHGDEGADQRGEEPTSPRRVQNTVRMVSMPPSPSATTTSSQHPRPSLEDPLTVPSPAPGGASVITPPPAPMGLSPHPPATQTVTTPTDVIKVRRRGEPPRPSRALMAASKHRP